MSVYFKNIPQALREGVHFCTWRYERRKGQDKPTKVPYIPGMMERASTNDPSTFRDFNTAMMACAGGNFDGIGIRVENGIGAIDIDHCIRKDGSLNDVATGVLDILPTTYFEKSPSGTGLRGFFRLPEDFAYDRTVYFEKNSRIGMEVYLSGKTNRFVTVTGDVYQEGTIAEDPDALRELLDTFMKRKKPLQNRTITPCSYLTDEQVIQRATSASNGENFKILYEGDYLSIPGDDGLPRYETQSDADMAFVSMLAFWCGNNEEQMDRIFRTSALMRPKWDRETGDSTYGQITLRNAVAMNTNIYTPSGAPSEFVELDEDGNPERRLAAGMAKGNGEGASEEDFFEADLSYITLTLDEMQPQSNPRYVMEDMGLGYMFADYYEPIARFVEGRKCWYVYDGAVWRADESALRVAELAKDLANKLFIYATQIEEPETKKRYIQRMTKLQFRKARETMVKEAQSVYPLTMMMFDRDIYLFNCRNGTLDLRSGEFHPHDPTEFHTKMSQVVYDPDAVCERWIRFMEEVTEGTREERGEKDQRDLIRYLQKAFGYSLSGDTTLECLFTLYGPKTRNGKGTTMETFLKLMGEYGKNANPEMLASKFGGNANSSGPTEDIARLAGARFVNISEPDKKITIDAALTKRLTGNDSITARYLHENSFQFRPQFKIFINSNHRPNITDLTLFESERIKEIPFNRHFKAEERDTNLKAFFAEGHNLSGILNWCLEGFKLYQSEGLAMPECVKASTEEYYLESDKVGQFVSECIVKKEGEELTQKRVYDAYRAWCNDNNYMAEGKKKFLPEIRKRFKIEKRRPWKREPHSTKTPPATFMVNDVMFADEGPNGEGLDEFAKLDDLVPD